MQNDDIKVSIIVPCYNVEQYVEECLTSICGQTYKNLEIICVDDGSIDDTQKILRHWQEKDERIQLICQKNQYAGAARNTGIKIAKGKYMCFLDADDFFEKNMIEHLVFSAEKYNSDIVLCNARFLNNQTRAISEPTWFLNVDYLENLNQPFALKDVSERIFSITSPVPWNKLYRRKFVEKNQISFQEIKRNNDIFFVLLAMTLAEKISFVDERLVYYRIENESSLQGFGKETNPTLDFFEAFCALKKELILRGLYQTVEKEFLNRALSGCMSFLQRQSSVEGFVKVYNFLQKEGFTKLGLTQDKSELFNCNQKEYENICTYNVTEYLFQKNKELQKAKGERFLFPYDRLGDSRKIIIYGAGEVGKAYYRQLIENQYYQIVLWVDKRNEMLIKKGLPVQTPKQIGRAVFDKIVIAIEDKEVRHKIKERLKKEGIEEDKII